MSNYTCLSCHVAFSSGDGQRDHFRSDWHRYNLLRKVAELPPVSRDTFNDRAQQVESKVAQVSQSKEEKKRFCKPCGRCFSNDKSFSNHLNSKKHIEKLASFAEESNNRKNSVFLKNEEMDLDSDDDDDEEAQTEEVKLSCKSCSQSFPSQVAYYNHMKSKQHMMKSAMFYEAQKSKKGNKVGGASSSSTMDVDSDNDSDFEEVDWEGDAVELKDCLFCTHHSATLKKKLEHMSVEHSFFIPDLEYCVDVTGLITYLGEKIGCGYECIACGWVGNRCPTLDAVQKHMKDKSHCTLNIDGDKVLEYEEFYDYSSTYPDTDAANPDDEVVVNVLCDDYQLVLPSGASVGHRTLMRYYRQKLNPDRTIAVKKTPGRSFTNILSQYRALGWHGATQADVVRKSKDIRFMQKIKSQHHLRLGIKANKLQHHFRLQNPV